MGVLEDVVGGVDVGDHDELAVALQRRLEQVRQLRVTVLWTAGEHRQKSGVTHGSWLATFMKWN